MTDPAARVISRDVRVVAALPAVRPGCRLGRSGLLPERFGVQLPGVLGPFPSRLGTLRVPKALLYLGRLLVQVLGAAVSGELPRLRSPSAIPCSRHPVRFIHRIAPHSGSWLSSLWQPSDGGRGILAAA